MEQSSETKGQLSAEADVLLNGQETSIRTIANAIRNLKKKGKANINLPILRRKYGALEKEWELIQKRHAQLLSAVSVTLAEKIDYFVNDDFAEAQEKYEEAQDFVVTEISKLTLEAEALPGKSSSKSDTNPPTGPAIKLPELTIPRYSGDPTGWEHFADLFSAAVIRNVTLSNAQRLQYLNSCLDGDALATISSFTIADRNFEAAWAELQQRFHNENVIISSCVAPMTSLRTIRHHDLESIQQVTVGVKQSLAALQGFGYETNAGGPLLQSLIIQKMEPSLKEVWERSRKDSKKYPTWEELYSFLSDLTTPLLVDKATGRKSFRSEKEADPQKAKAKTNLRTHNTVMEKPPPKSPLCTLCKDSHLLTHCQQFKKLNAREKYLVVKTSQYCIVCLSSEHTGSRCKSGDTCEKCGGAHHGWLHYDTFGNQGNFPKPKERKNTPHKKKAPRNSRTIQEGQTPTSTPDCRDATSQQGED